MVDSRSGMSLEHLVIPASKESIKDHKVISQRLRNQVEEPMGQRLHNFSNKKYNCKATKSITVKIYELIHL